MIVVNQVEGILVQSVLVVYSCANIYLDTEIRMLQ